MTVRLGMFTMPFHHPARDYADLPRRGPGSDHPRGSARLYRGLRRRALQLVERAHHLAADLPGDRDQPHARHPVGHGRDQHAPRPSGHGGGAGGHVRSARARTVHHGHRPGRPRERPRALRLGPGRAAPADGARVHRHGAEALVSGSAVSDRRPLLEDLARAGRCGPSSRSATFPGRSSSRIRRSPSRS